MSDTTTPTRPPSVRKTYSSRQKQKKGASKVGNDSGDEQEGTQAANTLESRDSASKVCLEINRLTTVEGTDADPPTTPLSKLGDLTRKPPSRSEPHSPKSSIPPVALSNSLASQASSMPPPSQIAPQRTFNIPTAPDNFTITPYTTRRSVPHSPSMASVSISPTTLKPAHFDVPCASPSSSSNRAESPEDSGDEAVATDEATPARKRKSEGDRIQFFKNDPLCKELEPLRALCANCNTWVDLHQKRKYVMKEWVVHQKSCKRGSVAPTSPSTRVTPARPPVSREQSVQLKDEDSESPARKVKLRRFTEVERKSILDNDPRSGEVRPQEVFCIPCNKFIRLSTKTSYALYNWEAHSSKCFKTHPLPLLQHTQQGSQFVPQTEPKPEPLSEAISMNGIYRTEETPTQPNGADNPIPSCEAGPSGVDSTPSETTDTTLVDRSPSRKRAREDDEEEEEAEGSRSVRPRTESYQPPSGLWRRLSEPIFKFVRDFREGFGSTSSAPSIS